MGRCKEVQPRLNPGGRSAGCETRQPRRLMTDVAAPEVDVWTPIGPIAINWSGGSSTGVLFHIAIPVSNPSVIYVSSPTSGVWASKDHGATWRAASGDLRAPACSVI